MLYKKCSSLLIWQIYVLNDQEGGFEFNVLRLLRLPYQSWFQPLTLAPWPILFFFPSSTLSHTARCLVYVYVNTLVCALSTVYSIHKQLRLAHFLDLGLHTGGRVFPGDDGPGKRASQLLEANWGRCSREFWDARTQVNYNFIFKGIYELWVDIFSCVDLTSKDIGGKKRLNSRTWTFNIQNCRKFKCRTDKYSWINLFKCLEFVT